VHVSEWYDDHVYVSDVELVIVARNGAVLDINASLAIGATIVGSVTKEASSGPGVSGICVTALDTGGFFHGEDETEPDGSFAVTGLPSIDLKLVFEDCATPIHHLTQWYGGTTFATADVLRPGGPGTTLANIDIALQPAGSIGGIVTDAQSQDALPDVCVEVTSREGELIDVAMTDRTGAYEAGGLRAGFYSILFRDCSASPKYVWEWYHDEPSLERSDPVTVALSETAGVDEQLLRGGVISGRVSDDHTGEQVSGVCVFAVDRRQEPLGFAQTFRDGQFAIPVHPGVHHVFYQDCSDTPPDYNQEWWRNRQTFDAADDIVVERVGATVPARNASLTAFLPGDVDCTRVVTAIDAALILQGVASLLPEFPCLYNSDPDRDGFYSALDAALVLQYVAGLLDAL
jgi:hypothetical protein